MKVKRWVSYDNLKYKENDFGGMGGWVKGENFDEYLKAFKPEAHPYLIAIKDSVIKRKLRLTGQDHQYSKHGVPLFDDGTVSKFSYRGWGDLMAAIWNSEENTNKYKYMDFYM